MFDFFLQHVALVALVVASAVMLAWPEVQKLMHQEKRVSTLEATKLINHRQALIIDLRKREDFDLGHLPKARHLTNDDLVGQGDDLKKSIERPVLLVASNQNTALAGSTLRGHGFGEVYVLEGGMSAWAEANLPMARSSQSS